jgi:hypothetical protein
MMPIGLSCHQRLDRRTGSTIQGPAKKFEHGNKKPAEPPGTHPPTLFQPAQMAVNLLQYIIYVIYITYCSSLTSKSGIVSETDWSAPPLIWFCLHAVGGTIAFVKAGSQKSLTCAIGAALIPNPHGCPPSSLPPVPPLAPTNKVPQTKDLTPPPLPYVACLQLAALSHSSRLAAKRA